MFPWTANSSTKLKRYVFVEIHRSPKNHVTYFQMQTTVKPAVKGVKKAKQAKKVKQVKSPMGTTGTSVSKVPSSMFQNDSPSIRNPGSNGGSQKTTGGYDNLNPNEEAEA